MKTTLTDRAVKAAHTPGPWTAVQDGNKVDWYLVDEDESVIVFGLSEPDARLTAAAPDMLAALKAAEIVLLALCKSGSSRKALAAYDRICGAIKKAEGTS
jgi:hypothetical protein